MRQRIDLRFPLELPVVILNHIDRSAYQIVEGRIRNMSFTGMYVDSIAVTVADRSYIYACITDTSCGKLNLGGFVVRHGNQGIGILFDDYGSDISVRLGRLLSQSLDNHRNRISASANDAHGSFTNH
ncbi:MAG: hypothetical protein AB7Q01_10475 [Gammaproteobacteria bacterium]